MIVTHVKTRKYTNHVRNYEFIIYISNRAKRFYALYRNRVCSPGIEYSYIRRARVFWRHCGVAVNLPPDWTRVSPLFDKWSLVLPDPSPARASSSESIDITETGEEGKYGVCMCCRGVFFFGNVSLIRVDRYMRSFYATVSPNPLTLLLHPPV